MNGADYFAELGEPRRPWPDAAALREKFLRLSAETHPDRFHNAGEEAKASANRKYSALNTAFSAIQEPKERLLHLLELERGVRPDDIRRIPAGTMELFMEIGQACRDADIFLSERGKTASPLLKVKLFEKGMEWTDKLRALQRKISIHRDALFAELEAMNPAWEKAPPPGSSGRAAALPLERLEDIYRSLSYVARWDAQIQERLVQLSA